MKNHSLILSTTKVSIPETVTIDFVTKLINSGLTGIEYFGQGIDNPLEEVEPDMKLINAQTSYFEFYFDTEGTIDYDSMSNEDTNRFIIELIEKSANIEMRADDKDISIYL
ncbi:hypothetical protein [Flavobacterium denitrificans]|uniref:hypothetical protein n=1 Tax=Flavobacterium denitrificans TaxID=281361 RepID=UPI000424747A|nr:hypothetical protein [Flavobacterium denitrificans]